MARIDPLFLTEAELAARIGVSAGAWKAAALILGRQGFPRPDPLFENRRYWPACKAFLDQRYGLGTPQGTGLHVLDGKEAWQR